MMGIYTRFLWSLQITLKKIGSKLFNVHPRSYQFFSRVGLLVHRHRASIVYNHSSMEKKRLLDQYAPMNGSNEFLMFDSRECMICGKDRVVHNSRLCRGAFKK